MHAARFQAGAPAHVANGHVLMVTEEDQVNDGDELLRDRAGTSQTRHVPDLAGGASIAPLDIINPVKFGDGLSTTIGGSCSAH